VTVDITYKQRLEINAAARALAQRDWGVFSRVDVSSRYRTDREQPEAFNLLTLLDEGERDFGPTDLYDFAPLLSLKRIEGHPSGCARLALYIYGGGELLDCFCATVNADGTTTVTRL
jgi:hypothetical protein